MKYSYNTNGTCSRKIDFEIDDRGNIHNVSFTGGCNGNLKGICSLVEGLPASQVVSRLKGIECGMKGTSCPDQLATAIENVM